MKCKSCEATNPPEFIWAIANNICAGCGSELLAAEDKELLDELKNAMERMPNNPQGVAGWLLSNYKFQKIGEAKPVEHFHVKKEPNEGQLKIADNTMQNFLKRTGQYENIQASKTRIEKLKGISKTIINDSDDYDEENYGENHENEEDINFPSENEFLSQSEVSMIRNESGPPLSQDELMALAHSVEQIDKGSQALQHERLKRLRARQELESAGSVGKIKRSS